MSHLSTSARRLAIAATCLTVLIPLIAAGPSPAADSGKQKQFLPSNFRVEIDGVTVEGFKEVSGIESEIEVIETSESRDANNPVSHKRPGKAKYGKIILTRQFVKDDPLREWYKKVLAGTTDRKSGSVIYLDRAGKEVMRYNFFEAWPMRWNLPELNSKEGTALESIEFVVEKVERI